MARTRTVDVPWHLPVESFTDAQLEAAKADLSHADNVDFFPRLLARVESVRASRS